MEIREECERCGAALPPDCPGARVCSFECTFCLECADHGLAGRCPNCGGELVPRPRRHTYATRVVDHQAALARIGTDPRFVETLRHGTMSVELYAPVGSDPQSPHAQDELYVVATGSARLRIGEISYAVRSGSVAFVRAGEDHRFEDFTEDFTTWVVFWGPPGGER